MTAPRLMPDIALASIPKIATMLGAKIAVGGSIINFQKRYGPMANKEQHRREKKKPKKAKAEPAVANANNGSSKK